MKKLINIFFFVITTSIGFSQNTWINELHYDNFGTDVGEFVEIVIENPGSYLLSDFQVTLYNGNGGASYNSETVDAFTVGGTSGNYTFYYWDLPTNGIQNGSPDGLALSYQGTVISGQFLSYEGTLTAVDGPAIGLTSTDIGVAEPGEIDSSLYLIGTGTEYSDFTWTGPDVSTKGTINNGQTLSTGTSPTISVTPSSLLGFSYFLGGGPSSSQSYNLSGTNLTPASGDIIVSGSANYEISSDDISFVTNLSIPYTGGALSSTSIYVRLKAGLTIGTYDEIITNSGGGAATQNVLCNGAVIKDEPTNHVTSFNGVLGNPEYYYTNLSWIDAIGATEPDGYLIKRSDIDFSDIADPVDGVPETNSFSVQNVPQDSQFVVFTGFASTTYYFKIFPYTNAGNFIDYKIDGSVPQFSINSADPPFLPFTENFEYATGSFLTDNGWVAHSGAGNLPIQVNDSPLTYNGYLNSGIGKSVSLVNPLGASAEDDNTLFASVSSNSVYASFLVNISFADTNGIYFFHFGPENSTFLFYGKVFVQNDGLDKIRFGVSKNSNADAQYTPFDYDLNTTYLLVVKYTFNSGTTTDDEVRLWVNPVLNGTEPTPDLTQFDSQPDAIKLDFVALRQASSLGNGPALTLSGIRVDTAWVPETGSTTTSYAVNILNSWNMVSVAGTNPAGMAPIDWWPGLDGAVYKYAGGYTVVTTTAPGEGYWMKHTGPTTYNYSGIQIVPHTDVPLLTGWNLVGLYENSVPTGSLTTNPPGIIIPPIYAYTGSYVTAASIDPGYAYWVKSSGPGVIQGLTPPLGKGGGEVVEYFKEDWGRITFTDATGKNFTLYAVNGQVELDNYELPPLPPEGMFDIRYGSGRIAEDLNAGIQTIDLRGITYPLIVNVENIDITLQDETGKKLNAELRSGENVTIGSSLEKLVVLGGEFAIPDEYALEQNYPNPFNPSTTIKFSLPEATDVVLTIYNALGQKVGELVNSKLEAGRYSYQWDAGNVASGMYIYELRTDKFVSLKKMMLLK